MIWLIIGLVVFVVMTIRIFCDDFYDLGDKIFFSFVNLLLSIFITFVVLLLSSVAVSSVAEVDYNMVSDTKIIALKDNQNIDGRFYIMGGYVDEDLYYYYATETDFGYKTEKVKSENAYIKYTNGDTHIEKYEPEFVNEFAYLFGFPMQLSRHIIYCPEGTVTNEFRVDLE